MWDYLFDSNPINPPLEQRVSPVSSSLHLKDHLHTWKTYAQSRSRSSSLRYSTRLTWSRAPLSSLQVDLPNFSSEKIMCLIEVTSLHRVGRQHVLHEAPGALLFTVLDNVLHEAPGVWLPPSRAQSLWIQLNRGPLRLLLCPGGSNITHTHD